MQSTRYPCRNLMTLEFSLKIFEKSSNITFYENPYTGSWLAPCGLIDGWTNGRKEGRTERHTEAYYLLFAILRTAKKMQKSLWQHFNILKYKSQNSFFKDVTCTTLKINCFSSVSVLPMWYNFEHSRYLCPYVKTA